MAANADITITFKANPQGTFELVVATDEGYNPRMEREIGPEEMLAVASLIDQFKGFQRGACKAILRDALRAQATRAERELETAKRQRDSIPAKEARLRELRRAMQA